MNSEARFFIKFFNEPMLSKREAPEYIAKGIGACIPLGVLLGAGNFLKSSLAVFYVLTFLRYSKRLHAMGHISLY